MAKLRRVRKLKVLSRTFPSTKPSLVRTELNERLRLILLADAPVFDAPLTSSLIPTTGTLLSFDGEDQTDATVTDWEGLVHVTKAEEARFPGARRVENICAPLYEFVDNLNYSSVVVGDTATITKTAGAIASFSKGAHIPTSVGECRASVYIRLVSGTLPATQLYLYGGSGSSGTDIASSIPTDGSWKRVAADVIAVITAGAVGLVDLNTSSAYVIEVKHFQYEDVTGQANQNPSEFVSVGVGTEAELNADLNMDNPSSWSGIITGSVTGNKMVDDGGTILLVGSRVQPIASARTGAVYAVTYTRGGTSTASFAPSYGGQVLTSRTANGTYTEVIVATSTTALGVFTSDAGFTTEIYDVSVKEINHGSNVDGVKYFDTLNYNTVTSNIVSQLAAPVGAGVQQLSDPDFTIPDAISPTADFQWTASTWQVASGQMQMLGFGSLASLFPAETGKYFRIEYDIAGTDTTTLSTFTFGGVPLPKTVGTHSVIIKAGGTQGLFVLPSFGNYDVQFNYVRITPLTDIPEDYLEGVLVEEASTNRLYHSGTLEHALWTTSLAQTTGTFITAPDGTDTGVPVEASTTGSASHLIFQSGATNLYDPDNSVSVTFSVYAKKKDHTWCYLEWVDEDPVAHTVWFNLDTGTVGTETLATGSITPVGSNGWYRITLTATNGTLNAAWQVSRIGLTTGDGVTTYAGVVGEGTYFWGAQLEELPYPTTYIPTAGSAAGRNDEFLKEVPPPAFINSSALSYTIFGEFTIDFNAIQFAANAFLFELRETSTSNNINLYLEASTGLLKGQIQHDGNPAQYPLSDAVITSGRYKYALRFDKNTNTATMFLNGVKQSLEKTVVGDTTFGTLTTFGIGALGTGSHSNTKNKEARIITQALSDAKCISETTL